MNKKIAIISIAVLVLLAAGFFLLWFDDSQIVLPKDKKVVTQEKSKESTPPEKWTKNPDVLMENTTSTCTLRLDDGTYRMYFMAEGAIFYADSKDGTTFGEKKPTGVTQSMGKMISNPSVLEISKNDWIMVYEEQPEKKPGPGPGGPPSSQTQRNLYLATSSDGKNFKKVGIAIDSSKEEEDNFFASVPELVKLPDRKVRMYYVSGGEAIGSAISTDKGRTWKREPGFRLEDFAVDPEIIYENGKWIMYYATLPVPDAGTKSAIYKATSKDGLTWTKDNTPLIKPDNAEGFVVDPDVIKIGDSYKMFFGEAPGGLGAEAQRINLFYADKVVK